MLIIHHACQNPKPSSRQPENPARPLPSSRCARPGEPPIPSRCSRPEDFPAPSRCVRPMNCPHPRVPCRFDENLANRSVGCKRAKSRVVWATVAHMPLFCGNGPLCSMTESLCLCSMDGEGRRLSARRLLAVRGLPSRLSRRMRFGATGCRRAVRLGAVRRACRLPFAMARSVRALAHAAMRRHARGPRHRARGLRHYARRSPPAAVRR